MKKVTSVNAFIESAPEQFRDTLTKLRRVIQDAAPQAVEKISYGMPFYEYGGSGFKGRLFYFSVSEKYISIYIPPSRIPQPPHELQKYQVSKSAYHFPLNANIPFDSIANVIRNMVKKIDADLSGTH